MTTNDGKEILDLIMSAVNKAIASQSAMAIKNEPAIVRFIDGQTVYVRPMSDMSTPRHETPLTVSDLDTGDVSVQNATGEVLIAGDVVDVIYSDKIDRGVIIRRRTSVSNAPRLITSLPSPVSVADSSWTSITSTTIPTRGVWLVWYTARFKSNSTGIRKSQLSRTADADASTGMMTTDTKSALNGDYTYLRAMDVITTSGEETFYVNVWQNSGTSFTVTGRFYALRLG